MEINYGPVSTEMLNLLTTDPEGYTELLIAFNSLRECWSDDRKVIEDPDMDGEEDAHFVLVEKVAGFTVHFKADVENWVITVTDLD